MVKKEKAIDALNLADDKGKIYSILDVVLSHEKDHIADHGKMVGDLISRQAAIEAICEDGTQLERQGQYRMTMAERKQRDADILDALPSVQQWVPCSERLPEYGEAVLTNNRDGDYEINHIIDDANGEWFWDGVVAWMPLPEPYKDGEHEKAD